MCYNNPWSSILWVPSLSDAEYNPAELQNDSEQYVYNLSCTELQNKVQCSELGTSVFSQINMVKWKGWMRF